MSKIKKDDEVVVIAGRDKGRRGEVLRVLKDGRLLVAGVNMVKKHTRANPNVGERGGIVDKEAPIQVSNVAIWNQEEERADHGKDGVDERAHAHRHAQEHARLLVVINGHCIIILVKKAFSFPQ